MDLRPGRIVFEIRKMYEKVRGVDFVVEIDKKEAGTDSIKAVYYYHMTDDAVYRKIFRFLKQQIRGGSGFMDFGCGKGRILYEARKHGYTPVCGVELSEKIVDIANRNMHTLRANDVRIICDDARNITQLDEFNIFYFYNPFSWEIMQDVLQNIKESVKGHPRDALMIYYNPVCAKEIAEYKEFQIVERTQVRMGLRRRKSHWIYFYKIKGA